MDNLPGTNSVNTSTLAQAFTQHSQKKSLAGSNLYFDVLKKLGVILAASVFGATTAYLFTSISPLAGAITLGIWSTLHSVLDIANKFFNLFDEIWKILIGVITTVFITHVAAAATFSYLGLAPLSFKTSAIFTLASAAGFVGISQALKELVGTPLKGPK